MDYKEKINQIMGVLGLSKETPEKEELAAKDMAPEAAPAQEAAPVEAPSYVTVSEFNSMREEMEMFKKEVVDALAAIVEMGNKTEKNAVPAEMASQEETEEVEEEVVELAAEPVKHDPEANVKDTKLGIKIAGGRKMTTEDIVFKTLAERGLWN